ncbi:MAG: DUF192 domain-containing protein [Nitrososphaeraceae archaeon]
MPKTITLISNIRLSFSIITIFIITIFLLSINQEEITNQYLTNAFNQNQSQTHSNFESSLKGELLVENAKSNSVSIIDLYNNKIIKHIIVGEGPHDIKISDDQQLVYTSDIDSGTVSILNLSNNSLNQINLSSTNTTDIAVHGIALNNDTIYTGDIYGGKVLSIEDNKVKYRINVGLGPEYMEVRPDGRVMYVANLWSPISVVDLNNKSLIKSIDSGKTPHGLSFNSNGSLLYIVNMYSNTLSVIDSLNHNIINTIDVGKKPEYVKLSPDERFAYVTNMESDTVSKISINSFKVVKDISVGKGPHGVAFSADGDLMYISNMKSNDVSVIDTSTDKVIGNIAVGIEPHQIVLKKPYIRILLDNIDKDINTIDNNKNTIDKTITNPIYIEIANDPYEIQKGLMFRKSLEWNNGMLFVYGDERYRSFWMKNTNIPLDIIFVDKNFKIVDIKKNAKPCLSYKCPSYPSKAPANYVLEVNGDFVNKNKIQIGDKLII